MNPPDPALVARWRRLTERINAVRAAVGDADEHRCPDAVAAALDALYEIWEYWTGKRASVAGKFGMNDEDSLVTGDHAGEIAAALMHARGAKTHAYVEFGDFTDTYSDTYYDHYGAWRWQHFASTEPRYATRNTWYQQHVAEREVTPVFDAALSWLKAQPELNT